MSKPLMRAGSYMRYHLADLPENVREHCHACREQQPKVWRQCMQLQQMEELAAPQPGETQLVEVVNSRCLLPANP